MNGFGHDPGIHRETLKDSKQESDGIRCIFQNEAREVNATDRRLWPRSEGWSRGHGPVREKMRK